MFTHPIDLNGRNRTTRKKVKVDLFARRIPRLSRAKSRAIALRLAGRRLAIVGEFPTHRGPLVALGFVSGALLEAASMLSVT